MSKNICMLGICGAGMAPLAIYLVQRGDVVYGWDDYVNLPIKDLLVSHGVIFMPKQLLPPNCDCVVRSSAVNEQSNSVCQRAAKDGIEIFRRGEFLAKICRDRKLLAIVGSHGKTSVSGTCVEILRHNGLAFDYVVGGFFKGKEIPPSAYNEKSEWIVAEVDESDGTIENFSPECTIALNYDDDHIYNYGNRDNFLKAFEKLFAQTKSTIFVPEDDIIFTNMASNFEKKYVKIQGLNGDDFSEKNKSIALFCVRRIFNKDITLPDKITGIQRRNDVMFKTEKFVFLNDYAHHPTEINSLLRYARTHYRDYELNIIFQPHRLSRTKQYFAEFAANLDMFDRPFVVELYAAFEEKIEGVSSNLVFNEVKNPNKKFLTLSQFETDMRDIYNRLSSCDKKQLVMFVGAGNILYHAKAFIGKIAFEEVKKAFNQARIKFAPFEDLTRAFSIKVPTSARIHVNPATHNELIAIVNICHNLGIKYVIIGNGTKILPPDGMINAVVITLDSDYWKSLEWIENDTLRCKAGISLRDFCKSVSGKGFLGTEKLSYIPSHMGGAILMNAGAHGQTISDHLVSIETLDPNGVVHTMGKADLSFGYRTSSITRDNIILSATFRFSEQAPQEYFTSMAEELLNWRKTHQPKGINFGSVFKNGDDFCAGELIDRAGLKGASIGGAAISEEHANFIINRGNASFRDIEKLIDLARYTVYIKFGKFLKTEVNILRA
ncbi:MAG: UDP-N-acetylmuramate dehydrogenase [Puniceicoccales bacterium]|jgi:UDP-N-acetylenolpyruvoylglucosamine reductase|nr:UDP-N-acetylmuramate dehydrogenase [Puniceicoccales bacterium]